LKGCWAYRPADKSKKDKQIDSFINGQVFWSVIPEGKKNHLFAVDYGLKRPVQWTYSRNIITKSDTCKPIVIAKNSP